MLLKKKLFRISKSYLMIRKLDKTGTLCIMLSLSRNGKRLGCRHSRYHVKRLSTRRFTPLDQSKRYLEI